MLKLYMELLGGFGNKIMYSKQIQLHYLGSLALFRLVYFALGTVCTSGL